MRSPLLSRARLLRWFAAVSFAGLLASVLAVAAVAVFAESVKRWGSYFVMEQAMAVGTPVAVAFFGLSVVAGFGLVYAADEA